MSARAARRKRSGVLVVSMAAVLLAALGCSARPRQRLAVAQDTLVLHGYESVRPPVRGLVRNGELTLVRRNQLTLSSDTAVEIRFGEVRCRKAGSARVTAAVGGDAAHFTVICQPARRLVTIPTRTLTISDPPEDASVEAELDDGRVERWLPQAVAFENPGVVRYDGGRYIAVAAGRTMTTADFGGLTVRSMLYVREVVARDTLSLRSGEFRAWRLARGRYTITVKPAVAGDALQWLDLAAEGTRCTRMESAPATAFCVVYDRADVGVRNVIADARVAPRRALVELIHTP